jgi:hypothetical protein
VQEYSQKALKNGHCGPPRSAYALSFAARRDARFILARSEPSWIPSARKKVYELLAVDAATA